MPNQWHDAVHFDNKGARETDCLENDENKRFVHFTDRCVWDVQMHRCGMRRWWCSRINICLWTRGNCLSNHYDYRYWSAEAICCTDNTKEKKSVISVMEKDQSWWQIYLLNVKLKLTVKPGLILLFVDYILWHFWQLKRTKTATRFYQKTETK